MKLFLAIAALSAAVCAAQSNEGSLDQGKAVFRSNCAFCHGLTAQGGRGPNLVSSSLVLSGGDDAIKKLISHGVAGTNMPGFDLAKDDLDALVQFLHGLSGSHRAQEKTAGDAAAGKAVYSRSGCSNCHLIGTTGSIYGPDLTRIGGARSVEYLRESIVDPSADIADNYGGVTVVTSDGRKISGVRINEDTFTVQIRKPDQSFALFEKSEVKEVIHETRSMMPSYSRLSSIDLQNLIAYLVTLRGQQASGADATKAQGIH